MYWTDGSVYKGEWKKGIQHGRGVMTFPDGRIKDGYFENNVFKGATQIQEGSAAEHQIKESTGPSSIEQPGQDSLGNTRGSIPRAQREVRIKTRGGSNSVRRTELNDNNSYSTQMADG